MATLYITRGLPGAGKTTKAKAWVAEDPKNRARINRDDLRLMVHNGTYIGGETEPRILSIRDTAVLALLRKGVDVVVDDTNLRTRVVRDLAKLAARAGADFEVWDMTDVPLETCFRRDSLRDEPVGVNVIVDMYERFIQGRSYPLPMPELVENPAVTAPYVPKPGTPNVALVDIDGTVAKMNGRSAFDYSRVGEDLPNEPVIEVVRALEAADNKIVFLSGRSDECADATINWLCENVTQYFDALYMRKAGDYRKDAIVKAELFDTYIRDNYNVVCVLDDRNQVVEMWRSIGLTVLQVAPGDF